MPAWLLAKSSHPGLQMAAFSLRPLVAKRENGREARERGEQRE